MANRIYPCATHLFFKVGYQKKGVSCTFQWDPGTRKLRNMLGCDLDEAFARVNTIFTRNYVHWDLQKFFPFLLPSFLRRRAM